MSLSSEALIIIIEQIHSGKATEVDKDVLTLDTEEEAWLNHLLKVANPSIIAQITLPTIDAFIRDLAGDNGKDNQNWQRVGSKREEIYTDLTREDNPEKVTARTAEILLTSLSVLVNYSSWAVDVAFYPQSKQARTS